MSDNEVDDETDDDGSVPSRMLLCPYVSTNLGPCPARRRCPYAHEPEAQRIDFGHWSGRRLGRGALVVTPPFAEVLMACNAAHRVPVTLRNNDPFATLVVARLRVHAGGECAPGVLRLAGVPPSADDCTWDLRGAQLAPGAIMVLDVAVASGADPVAFSCVLRVELSGHDITDTPAVGCELAVNILSGANLAMLASIKAQAAPFYPAAVRQQWDRSVGSLLATPQRCPLPVSAAGSCSTPLELAHALWAWSPASAGFFRVRDVELGRVLSNRQHAEAWAHRQLCPHVFCSVGHDDVRVVLPDARALAVALESSPSRLDALQLMLLLEERAMDEACRTFDGYFLPVERVKRASNITTLTLTVPGADEKRPLVQYGDVVRVRWCQLEAAEMEARVVAVRSGQVQLAAVSSKRLPRLERVHLRFDWNRTRFRRSYVALQRFHDSRSDAHAVLHDALFDLDRLPASAPALRVGDFACLDDRLSSQQRGAVAAAMAAVPGGPVVLVLGAAGSGKTETIVEIVRQAVLLNERVLLCAPSNGAADVLALRLLAVDDGMALLRLNAPQRMRAEVLGDGKLLRACVYDVDTGLHTMPASLAPYSVIVSTCVVSGWLQDGRARDWAPAVIVIDEAAQATEAEALIALALAVRDTRAVVLCGDPAQLGPTLRSRECLRLGDAHSLLERLAAHPAYAGALAPWKVTLTKNYRCHPELMALSARLFYANAGSNRTEACWTPNEAGRMLDFEDLRASGFPCAFYGVQGIDEHEGDYSFWNVAEALQVVELVQRLLASRAVGALLRPSSIGVVTPYYKQVRMIRAVLRAAALGDVRVGSVEDYQGQEELVLLVSCVRSSRRWLSHDRDAGSVNVGLMHNTRLLNVCITRAKCLLMLVGNPHTLSADPHWRALIAACIKSDTYHGCAFDATASVDWTPTEADSLRGARDPVDFAALGQMDLAWDGGL